MRFPGLAIAALAILFGISSGCSSDTAILINIDTDLRVPEELNGVRIKVDSDVKTLLDRTFSIPTQDDMPTTYTVTNETDKEVWVTVTVYGLLGAVEVAEDNERVLFVKGKTIDVDIYLRRPGPGDRDGGLDGARDAGVKYDAGRDSGWDGGAEADDGGSVDAAGDSGAENAGDSAPVDGGGPDGADASELSDAPDSSFDDALFDGAPFDDAQGGQDVSYPSDIGEDADASEDAGPDAGADTGDDAGCVPVCAGKCGGPDNCGATCPDNCVAPETCGGGGVEFACGCTKAPQPTACKDKCGSVGDGCGGIYNCGDCSDGYSCALNECVCVSGKLCTGLCCPSSADACHQGRCCTPGCAGKCGGVPDGCGGQCAACGASELCEATACVHCGDRGEKCCAASACNGMNVCKDNSCVPTNCAGLPDFANCDLVTTPDRRYDICVSGACVSPGCGDATCNTPGPHFPVPDTGQRKCYDGTAEIACPTGSGTPCNSDGSPPYCGQDAQYGWDLSHQPTERFTISTAVSDEPVVTDNVTGLLWQGCPAGLKGVDCLTGGLEPNTWDGGLAYCDSLDWGGLAGWRLPDPALTHDKKKIDRAQG